MGFRGLFKSTDSGTSWSPINEGLAEPGRHRSHPPPPSSSIRIIRTFSVRGDLRQNGVYKTSDGGANWAPFNDGLTNLDVRVLALSAGDSKALYAGTSGGVFQVVEDTAAK